MIYPDRGRSNSPGQMDVKVLGESTLGRARSAVEPVRVRRDRYTWKAPRDLPGPLPHDRSVGMDVFTADDGVRRFLPCPDDGLDGYIARAFQYGHSLLARDRNFTRDKWCDYLVAKLAFDRLNRVKVRMTRMLKSSADLSIHKALRSFLGEANILPRDLGLSASGKGRYWSVDKLLSEGRQAAQDSGLTSPSESEAISFGLFEAALRNPLQVAEGEAESLVRMSLYDFSRSGSRASEADRAEVWQRFHDLIRQHLEEDRARFNAWLAGGHSNLLKSIANLGGASGRKLERTVVNRAMLDLGWRGYLLVGECLEAFARAFSKALLRPLSPREQSYFQAMYYRQPYLGGLPLTLVMLRKNQIQPAIVRLWEQPGDEQLIGALHQVLRYYTEMIPLRREADRLAKKPGQRIRELKPELADLVPAAGANSSLLDEVFQDLIERRGLACPRCTKPLLGNLSKDGFQEGQSFQLEVQCEDHGLMDTVEVSWDELQASRALFIDSD